MPLWQGLALISTGVIFLVLIVRNGRAPHGPMGRGTTDEDLKRLHARETRRDSAVSGIRTPPIPNVQPPNDHTGAA